MKSAMNKRRTFLQTSGLALAGAAVQPMLLYRTASQVTIQEVIDGIMQHIPGDRRSNTVDTVKTGDPEMICKGIVTTFLATADVIKKATALGANLIITHEPTFYNHLDETSWLTDDPVYQAKRSLIDEHNIVIWRFHDYWHQHRPDGILQGFLEEMTWQQYVDPDTDNLCIVPEMSLLTLGRLLKTKLELERPFMIGDPDLPCQRIGVMLGAWGGRMQMGMLGQVEMDAIVVG
ncbi:MAG: Nif3-like dinuclear metal center hexameric protein, partial [Saprospiraceae bacterium]|nr:Nif3-like dinuclear metal center hexameric protein [Saprospiraceae bacterium]